MRQEIRRSEPSTRPGRSLQAAQHVGVVRMGTRTIQILPKMYRTATNTAAQVHEATANVLYLLHYAGQLPISEHAIAALSARNSDWFELLTYLFASHLQTAWHRGPARTYQRVNAAQTALKGKLRIADQLRRPGRNHLFALTFDEFTADTPLNRMLRFVVERLWRLTRSIANRRILADLRGWMDEVTLLPALSAADIEQVAIDRLNSRYAPLLTLAKLFLEQQAIQLAGGDTPSFAFTFDMNRLFEGFIAGFLVRYRAAILPEAMRHCQIHVQAHGMTHVLAHAGTTACFRLAPDIVLHCGSDIPIMIDTKYKLLNQYDRKLGVSTADFYQMYAYARRFACPRVVLLYPQTAALSTALWRRFQLDTVSGYDIVAQTIDIRLDLRQPAARLQLQQELAKIFSQEPGHV